MVLQQVLREIESARGPVDASALSRKLGVEQSALEGMLQFWVRKGRLRERPICVTLPTCAGGACGATCPLMDPALRSCSHDTPDSR